MNLTMRHLWQRRAFGSVGWATGDQILSAASNFVISIAVARGTGADGLGRFSIAFTAYLTVLGFSRSLVAEPLLAQRRGDERDAEAASVTLSLLFAVASGLVVGAVGLVLRRPELQLVAAALPVLLLQDLLRYHAFRRHRSDLAARLDGGWLVGSVLVWPIVSGSPSPAVAVVCWTGAALLGIAAGWMPVRPRTCAVRTAVTWWQQHARGLAGPLVLDSLFLSLYLQAMIIVISSWVGDGALGTLRAGQVYFGSLGMMFTAIGLVAVPRLARSASLATLRTALLLSGAQAALAIAVCAVLFIARPLLNSLLFGGSVDVPAWLFAPLAVQVVMAAASGGFIVLCKARGLGREIARCRLSSTMLGLVLIILGTLAFGLSGAAWAIAGQGVLYTGHLVICIARRTTTPDEAVEHSEVSDVDR